jgi:cobalt-zinc-cadmium efflux system outer membrane protein
MSLFLRTARTCALLACIGPWGIGVRVARGTPSPCGPVLSSIEVVRCALAQSPEVRAEEQALAALRGRRTAAGTLLPSYPTLAVSLAQRTPRGMNAATQEPTRTLNWYLTLSQEIEVAGQRSARLDVADAAVAAQVRRVAVAQQEVIAAALTAYYSLWSAQREQQLAAELSELAGGLSKVASARAAQALLAPVESRVAQAEATRLTLVGVEARQRAATAQAMLATLVGLAATAPPYVDIQAVEPDPRVPPAPTDELPALIARALTLRGELAAAAMERTMLSQQVRLLRRTRVPNVTLSAFAQSDGFDELVLGGGLAMGLPLPAPLGPSRQGEISEAQARVAQSEAELDRVRRRVQQEVWQAAAAHRAQMEALALLPPAVVEQARVDLRALAQAVGARQLPLREALLSQRTLIDLLQAHLNAQRGLLLSRVELLRATGLLTESIPVSKGETP